MALSAIEFSSSLKSGEFDFNGLELELCNHAEPFMRKIREVALKPWLFLVGPVMNSNVQQRFPNYSLSNPLQKAGIPIISAMEKVYWCERGRRVVGMYLTEWDAFNKCVQFMTRNSWSIGILTARNEGLAEYIEVLYESSVKEAENMPVVDINWLAIAESICPTGDFVLKTAGAFDDRDRLLKLIFAPEFSLEW